LSWGPQSHPALQARIYLRIARNSKKGVSHLLHAEQLAIGSWFLSLVSPTSKKFASWRSCDYPYDVFKKKPKKTHKESEKSFPIDSKPFE